MTTYRGDDGVVEVGANAVAEVVSFTVDEAVRTLDDSVKGDSWDTHKVSRSSWSGTINCRYDDGDTNGQVAMAVGASIALTLYPTGNASGRTKLSGTATITGTSIDSPDEIVGGSYTFQGNGALNKTPVV